MPLLDKLTRRALALLDLDFDIDLQLRGPLLSPITPTLYLGARPSPDDLPALRDAGITHIVTCLEPAERPSLGAFERAFHTLFLPLRDSVHQDLTPHLTPFWDFADRAHQHTPHAKLLIHCQVGVSRSAAMTLALLMRRRRLRFFDAFCEVRAKRPHVLPNVGFASQLQRLEHQHHPPEPSAPSSLALYLHRVCNVPAELETIQDALERHDHDALTALRALFGDDLPRVIQGLRH